MNKKEKYYPHDPDYVVRPGRTIKENLESKNIDFVQFVKEEIHLADFDQGQSEKDTIKVFDRWWKRKGSKIKRLSK